jgi:hypothetical protein
MERVQVLIDRLTEQMKRKETAAQLLVTVQLLQQELAVQQQQAAHPKSKNVSVILPSLAVPFSAPAEPQPVTNIQEPALPIKLQEPVQEPVSTPKPEMPEEIQPAPVQKVEAPKPAEPPKQKETITPMQSYTLRRPSITELLQERGEVKEPAPAPVAPPAPQPQFNVIEETPTLLQHTPQEEQKIHQEINQIIHGEQRSLNDQLKRQQTEVAHLLQDTPIKDLRKAIGINDKFLFLNELFNGDEAAYERSIKTINNFHVLQEAEYWINRELKLRLGWNDTKETVQHFYRLVRRRFS